MNIEILLPEIEMIKDADLREKTLAVVEDALKMGGWTCDDLDRIPFTMLIEKTPVSFLTHTRAVTEVSIKNAEILNRYYGDNFVDMDVVISGALLHDIGKLLEYKESNGKFVLSESAKYLRHPISGAALAYKHGIKDSVVHIIAMHSKEGDSSKRTKEGIIIHYADFVNFETLRA